jgi:hypothetical protein
MDVELQEEYVIAFDTRTVYWQYVIVSDYLKELTPLGVIHKSVQFIEQPGEISAHTFLSKTPIALKEQPDRGYQLVKDYDAERQDGKVVISNLPNPGIDRISLGRSNDQEKVFFEIFI